MKNNLVKNYFLTDIMSRITNKGPYTEMVKDEKLNYCVIGIQFTNDINLNKLIPDINNDIKRYINNNLCIWNLGTKKIEKNENIFHKTTEKYIEYFMSDLFISNIEKACLMQRICFYNHNSSSETKRIITFQHKGIIYIPILTLHEPVVRKGVKHDSDTELIEKCLFLFKNINYEQKQQKLQNFLDSFLEIE